MAKTVKQLPPRLKKMEADKGKKGSKFSQTVPVSKPAKKGGK